MPSVHHVVLSQTVGGSYCDPFSLRQLAPQRESENSHHAAALSLIGTLKRATNANLAGSAKERPLSGPISAKYH